MPNKKISIDISPRTILLILFIFILFSVLKDILNIIFGLLIAFLVTVAVSPLVEYLAKKRIPRAISASVILLSIFGALSLLVASIIKPLIEETTFFIDKLPELFSRFIPQPIDWATIIPQLTETPGNVLKIAAVTFSSFISFFTLVIISFYLLRDRPNWEKHLITTFGETKAKVYYKIILDLERRLGYWVRGEFFLMFTIGLLSYFGFLALGLPYAAPLGLIAGILELVPNVGPTIAAIPAVVVGFSVSPLLGLLALLISVVVQQLENNLIVPKIMQRAIGLHPIITILTLLIGFKLGGVLLAVIALPIVVSIQVIVSHLSELKKVDTINLD